MSKSAKIEIWKNFSLAVLIIIGNIWIVSGQTFNMKSETTEITYYRLNELANAAKNEVILDSLYKGSLIQINKLESIIMSKSKSISILKKDIIESKSQLLEAHEILNLENTKIKESYKKKLKKSKLKKWFFILPAGALGYFVGGLFN